jgi:site-specific recombinase XerD
MLVSLKEVIRAMAPDQEWRWLQDICNRVQRMAIPSRDKRARILPSPNIYAAAMRELTSVPLEDVKLKTAIRYRDALMLALMAARPLRVKNFQSLLIGTHLVQAGDKWLIVLSGEETKNHSPLEYFVPDDLVLWLETYISKIRPTFPEAADSNNLWINQYGTVLGNQFTYLRLVKTSERLLGKPINPHLYRDCAATSLAMTSPEIARAAAPLLGHRHFSTTEKYYIQANNIEAGRRLNAILNEIEHDLEERE